MFSLENRADKPLRINWPLNYTLQYVLQAVTLTGRCSVFLSFVCFSGFRFKYRRQVRSVLGLERRQTCALDPRFNSKSNCTQGNRVTSIGLHKKEFSVMCLSNRGGEAFPNVGVGSSKGLLYTGFPVQRPQQGRNSCPWLPLPKFDHRLVSSVGRAPVS